MTLLSLNQESLISNSPPTRTESLTFVNRFSLVGGLLYNSGEYPFQNRTFLSDFNNAQDSGIYLLGNVGSYKNSPGFNYGLMVVFASYYILQMCIDSSATTIKVRVCIDKNWSNWKSIPL